MEAAQPSPQYALPLSSSRVPLCSCAVSLLGLKSAVLLSEFANIPYALSATKAKTSSHRSILMFPDPYSSCDVEIYPDPKLVAGTVLENEVVWNVGWVVVVTVGRFVVVMGLSRVEGRYVKRVGIR